MTDPQDFEAGDEGPSKSELKRQDRELRDLGVALVELPASELEALDLPEKLRDAVEACRRITSHGARLRQEMFIAKVMRKLDVEGIRRAVAQRSERDRQRVRNEHALERWRERLLADEAGAWTELGTLVPADELQQLRSLARQARAEQAASRPPAAARQLFRRLAPFVGGFQSEMATAINSVFGVGGGGLMTIGQMSEFLVLGLIPLLAKSLSRKTLLAIGLFAYAARMALFAYVNPIAEATGIPHVAILMLGIAMHGFCFGCFIFVAFMVIDENTTSDVRATTQSLFGLVVFGVGIIVGSLIAGKVADWAKHSKTIEVSGEGMKSVTETDYTQLFSVPMWGAVACLVLLLLFYPGGKRTA